MSNFFRDDIGNISTSHMKVMDDAVELGTVLCVV
jgi:hypothetical protein